MKVASSVRALLKRLPGELSNGPEAATALALAAELDAPGNSATSKANCAKELRETLAALRAMAPAERKGSQLDDLAQRRQRRKAAQG